MFPQFCWFIIFPQTFLLIDEWHFRWGVDFLKFRKIYPSPPQLFNEEMENFIQYRRDRVNILRRKPAKNAIRNTLPQKLSLQNETRQPPNKTINFKAEYIIHVQIFFVLFFSDEEEPFSLNIHFAKTRDKNNYHLKNGKYNEETRLINII